jgi:hypothetical protein
MNDHDTQLSLTKPRSPGAKLSGLRRRISAPPTFLVQWWGPILACVMSLKILRPAVRDGLPPGSDMPYHFVRSTWAFRDFFANFRLDGWFPAFGVGAQGFLLYGPGAALHYAAVRVVTLGLLSEHATFRLLVFATLLAVPWCVRFMAKSFGLSNLPANMAAVFSLGVSCTFGGGFRGLLSTGLLPHQIALSYWCLALGYFAQLLRIPTTRSAVRFGICVGMLLITHPTSAWLLVITGLAIGIVDIMRRRRRPQLLAKAGIGAAVAVGLSAMWWMPLTRDSDPRQQLATWGVPSFRANLRNLANGKEAVRPGLALLIILGSLWLFIHSVNAWRTGRPSKPWRLGLAVGPLLALGFSHWLWNNYPNTVTLLLPVRGIGNWMIVGLLPLSLGLATLARRVSPNAGGWIAVALVLGLVAGPGSQLDTKFIKDVVARKPTPQLEDLADQLAIHVPANGRWVMPTDWPQEKQYGVDLPQYWLVGASGKPTLNGFGGDAVTSWDIWVTDHITEKPVTDAAVLLQRAGVTHVYAAGEKTGAYFGSAPQLFTKIWDSAPMKLFAVKGPGAAKFGETNLAFSPTSRPLQVLSASPENVSWKVEAGQTEQLTLARGYFTKWHATWNGKSVPVTNDAGLVSVTVGAEAGTLRLEFQRSIQDYLGPLVTLVTIGALVYLAIRKSRRKKPSVPAVTNPNDDDGVAIAYVAGDVDDWSPPAPVFRSVTDDEIDLVDSGVSPLSAHSDTVELDAPVELVAPVASAESVEVTP